MTIRSLLALAVLPLALAACGSQDTTGNGTAAAVTATPVAAPAGSAWTETVSATPEGGFRMGNPDAKVKLVEYGAYSCPHCAEFTEKATPTLRAFIDKGLVSWEFRPFLLSAIDVPVSLLVACQGPAPYFKLAEQVYADQQTWFAKLQSSTPEQQKALEGMTPAQQSVAVAKLAGLDQFMRVRGLPAAKAEACLADTAAAERLNTIRNEATAKGLTGTPTFFINDELVPDTFDWATLEPKLRAAIG